eukprot:219608_1
MSHQKDTFDDAELTSLALEIMNDISNKATLDPKDSFIYKANIYNDSSIYSNSSHYNSITETNNTEHYNDNDSSFIYSIGPPPNNSFSSKQYHKPVTLKSIWNPPPQHIPPSITTDSSDNNENNNENENDNNMYIDSSLFSTSISDISTSMPHKTIKRSQTPKCRVNPIPDFTECIQLQSKPLKIKKKKKRKKNKNLKDKNKYIDDLIWQKPIPKKLNPFSPKSNKKSKKLKSMTPNGKYRTYKKQKHKHKNKKLRTQSVATPPPYNQYNNDIYKPYFVELDGFDIFDCNM